MTARAVGAEILDDLPPEDPRARRSRRDLRRINALMGNARTVAGMLAGRRVETLLEIGAGDGAFARSLIPRLDSGTRVVLLDRQDHPSPPGVDAVVADVYDYLNTEVRFDAIVANLFLHHFEDDRLRTLLGLVARSTDLFVACEPRRSGAALTGCRMLRAIGCNDVTRHDARVSVRAGFREGELAHLWPGDGWSLRERSAPPFGHAFRAERRS